MTSFPSLPLFTDAFIADTGHLSAQETGAYLMLLMMAWRMPDCCLPDDDVKLCRWARVDPRTWQRIKPNVMEFWTFDSGHWHQKRLRKERGVVSKRAEAARANGAQGGRPKSLVNNDVDNPAGLDLETQEKPPNPNPSSPNGEKNIRPKPSRVRTQYDEDFEKFWKGYPTDSLMSKAEAWPFWQRMNDEDKADANASLPAFRSYCEAHPDYRPVHACRYLRYRRFEGFLATAARSSSQVFVEVGTGEWDAWQRHRKQTTGKGTPSTDKGGKSGWFFPSRWPPDNEQEAA